MRYILTFILVLGLGVAQAVTIQEARSYITNQDYPKAVVAYRTLLQQQPSMAKNADFNKFYGQSLCMTGAYRESIPYLEFGAKHGKTGAWWYLGISRQHLYEFESAIEALEKYKTQLSKNSTWIPRTDSIIAECEVGLKGIRHVQDVVILDSMIVPRKQFFAHYRLGAESGRLIPAHAEGNQDGMVFENQAGDSRLFAAMTDSTYRLYEQHSFNGQWEQPVVIASIDMGTRKMCFPFLRSDSETLYFACDSPDGFGGFDIYKTHYNSETERFYQPERLGMPFNSPYDDYMMAVDETHQIGWWATNRNVSMDGMICIYLFQFEETPVYLDGEQPERARIERIADSWRQKNGYEDLVQEALNAPQFVEIKESVRIPISDDVVYTSADQFHSKAAREAYESSERIRANLEALQGELEGMRVEWGSANANRKKTLRNQILQNEKKERQLVEQLAASQKKYRNLEILNNK
ncbi:MAG: hypothetical protein IJP70_04870 [Bacteroidales bacterium]|nr:hypothetical protein [Bacteroidales bacterium]